MDPSHLTDRGTHKSVRPPRLEQSRHSLQNWYGNPETVTPGATLLADKAYDTDGIRSFVAARGGWANIPPRIIRKGTFAFSRWVYRQRNLVERFFNRLKQMRGIATRYDRRADNYLAAVKLAAMRIWIKPL